MAQPKELPYDHNYYPSNGARDKNHVFQDGEYVQKPYFHQEYPKWVGAMLVNSAEEEAALSKKGK